MAPGNLHVFTILTRQKNGLNAHCQILNQPFKGAEDLRGIICDICKPLMNEVHC